VPTDERVSLTALACAVCAIRGCTLVCIWRDGRGAMELAYCGVPCAMRHGWPWLVSEKRSQRRRAVFTRPAA
jgi:hypothetical protein